LWGSSSNFWTIPFSQGVVVSPMPNPQLRGQVSVFISPRDKVAQLYPWALGFPFSRLLWQAGKTVEVF
jgi:hypothetical protein